MLFLAIILVTTKLAYTAEKFFLSADSISKNEENNTIKAEGNVNITNNNYKLKANEITYYLKEKKVFAKGNVMIMEKRNANVIYASEAELSNDLKSNFIKKHNNLDFKKSSNYNFLLLLLYSNLKKSSYFKFLSLSHVMVQKNDLPKSHQLY